MAAAPLLQYPGPLPPDLASAYRCQDEAIAMWPDALVGWKVGWVPPPWSDRVDTQRLVGPIFRKSVRLASESTLIPAAPIFSKGFAAVEAEFVFQLGLDAPPSRIDWDVTGAARLVRAMYAGVEIASSPLPAINELGPAVTVSDFGNNAGLLIGAEVTGWASRPLDTLLCECAIGTNVVGSGSAASVSGGPLQALAFALRIAAQRGRPLRAGDWVTTGATTGVHPISVGQQATAHFAGVGTLRCRAVAIASAEET